MTLPQYKNIIVIFEIGHSTTKIDILLDDNGFKTVVNMPTVIVSGY